MLETATSRLWDYQPQADYLFLPVVKGKLSMRAQGPDIAIKFAIIPSGHSVIDHLLRHSYMLVNLVKVKP